MNKDFWKILFCWLENASLEDIDCKRQLVQKMLDQITDRDLKADIRRILRLLDEEILARAELASPMSISAA